MQEIQGTFKTLSEMVSKILDAASRVSNEWTLIGFALAILLFGFYLVLRKRQSKRATLLLIFTLAICLLSFAPIALQYVKHLGVYRLRIVVIDPQLHPTDDADLTSSIGGEIKKSHGASELEIPAALRPADHKLTLIARVPSAFLTGRTIVYLENDYNPTVTIQLAHDASISIRGVVIDSSGNLLSGTRIGVVGYESEAIVTGSSGNFFLPAHVSDGQQTEIYAEKDGYNTALQWLTAGETPVKIVLNPKRH